MRDKFIIITIIGLLTSGFLFYRHSQLEEQSTPATLQTSSAAPSPAMGNTPSEGSVSAVPASRSTVITPVSNQPVTHLGVSNHASSNHRRSEQNRHSRSRSRSAGPVAKVQSHSIGQNGGEAEEAGELGDLSESAVTADNDSVLPEPVTKRSVIPGVNVAAWVNENRNKLKNAQITEDSPKGLRVYVGCVEVKKQGPLYLGEKQCEKLLAAESQVTTGRLRY